MYKALAIAGLAAALAVTSAAREARADELDDIIKSGELRCGVMLDFPPAGFRDTNNEPVGFDVEYCQDMAKALGVKATIVETPSPQRLPALVSGQVDINIGSVTATLERAKTVLFTNTYLVYKLIAVTHKGAGIKKWEDLNGKSVAVVRGTTPEIEYLKHCKSWSDGCKHQSYGSNGDQLLAFKQGKAEVMIEADAFLIELMKTEQGKDMEICCEVPNFTDWISIAVNRGDQGLRDWINLFIFYQVDSGRFAELYGKWFSRDAPMLKRDDVNF